MFRGGPTARAKGALRELVEARALWRQDPLTAEMLEAFGWGPLGEVPDDAARRGPGETG